MIKKYFLAFKQIYKTINNKNSQFCKIYFLIEKSVFFDIFGIYH